MSRYDKLDRFPIKITNFINPHLFHFKLENIVGQFDIDIEQKLRQHVDKCSSAAFAPELGAIVAAFIVPWNKWVRAEVDLILEECHSFQYVIWCMDHGVPMKLSSQHLRPLPKDLQDLKANSYTGGLAKCVPIEKRLNYASLKHETHDVDDFPEYLVANAKQTIDEAAEIFFVPRQTIGHQIFGDIAITKFCGTKIDLLSELVTTDSVKVCDRIIPKGIEDMRTIKKQRYENHLGNLNIRNIVKLDTTSSSKSAISVCTKDTDEDVQMILNWSRGNKEIAKQTEDELKVSFEQVLRKLDVYELPSNYLCRSENTINSWSSINIIARMNSMSSISEAHPYTRPDRADACDAKIDPKMNLLTRELRATSINSVNTNKTNSKKEPKKAIYIPAGHESDLVNFQKFNPFY